MRKLNSPLWWNLSLPHNRQNPATEPATTSGHNILLGFQSLGSKDKSPLTGFHKTQQQASKLHCLGRCKNLLPKTLRSIKNTRSTECIVFRPGSQPYQNPFKSFKIIFLRGVGRGCVNASWLLALPHGIHTAAASKKLGKKRELLSSTQPFTFLPTLHLRFTKPSLSPSFTP